MDNKDEESENTLSPNNFLAFLRDSNESTPQEEQLKLFRMEQDNLRQNIGCLALVLNMGVKGEEYGKGFNYAVDDDIDRGLIRQKLLKLVDKL